jgi:hypothetical protein
MNPVNSRSWSGVIINSGCTADEAYGEADKCYGKRRPGAKLALYDDTIRKSSNSTRKTARRVILERSSRSKAGSAKTTPSAARQFRRLPRSGSKSARRRPTFPRATSLAVHKRSTA